MNIGELRDLLEKYPSYLKVYVALPHGAGEVEPQESGTVIDHYTYGWLTLESEDVR